jgi:UDP-N-acetylglucosamine--N-acetylmuramyl-(pentapeptide) pyrophosphoryl-undecaprenol N-acetylglucosamine transferase
VYPALAVLKALNRNADTVQWVGGQDGMEASLVDRDGVPFKGIPAAGVHGVGLQALPGNLWKLLQGIFASRRILKEYKPDVLLFTGGYVAVPMAIAGRQIPSLLYVPDIEPGLALKFLARFTDCIALTAGDSKKFFAGSRNLKVTGYPIRPELKTWTRETGLQKMGLDENIPVLLVFGGSKGARSINRALVANLPQLLAVAQVVHISGSLDWEEIRPVKDSLSGDIALRYHPYPYLHEEMGAALASADLVISRAGASTLGEFPHFGLPAVLVPYPYAWRYQKVNADYLARQGAAVILEDADLENKLLPLLQNLLSQPQKLKEMSRVMRSLAKPQAVSDLADILHELAPQSLQRNGGASW